MMDEEGGLGALLGAYESESDQEDKDKRGLTQRGDHKDARIPTEGKERGLAPADDQPSIHHQPTDDVDMMPTVALPQLPRHGEEYADAYPEVEELDEDDNDGGDGGAGEGKLVVNDTYENGDLMKQREVDTQRRILHLPLDVAASPPGECDPEVQDRVARWLTVQQQQGKRLTDTLRASRDYRNPEFFRKMIEYWEIDEHGTCLPAEVFNPSGLPQEDTLPRLKAAWAAEEERKKKERAAGTGRIEFTSSSASNKATEDMIAKARAQALALAAAAKQKQPRAKR